MVLACALGASGRAGEPLPPNSEDGLFEFAGRLRDDEDHYRAITEYRRLLFHFPRTRHGDAARRAVAACYIAAERWDDAEAWLTEVEGVARGTPLARWAAFERGGVRLSAEKFGAAAAAFDEFIARYPKAPEAGEARWRGAWSLLLGHRFELAERAFGAIRAPDPHAEAAATLARECRRLAAQRRKSPLIASLLGIVPGLGHAYTGRYKDGLVALAVDGILGWGAASAFSKGARVAGAALGLFGVNFHLSSIFGAANWAHRTNRARDQKIIDRLRRKHAF